MFADDREQSKDRHDSKAAEGALPTGQRDPSIGREQLRADFRRMCDAAGLTMYVPANGPIDSPEMQERLLPGESVSQCHSLVNDAFALMERAFGSDGLTELRQNLEATALDESGEKLICLISAHRAADGRFAAPVLSALPDRDGSARLQPVRMPQPSEMFEAGVGVVGVFQSSRWAHPTLSLMFSEAAYAEALVGLTSIGRSLDKGRSEGGARWSSNTLPAASALMGKLISEVENNIEMEQLYAEASEGDQRPQILGVTNLEVIGSGQIELGVMLLGGASAGGAHAFLVPELVERSHAFKLNRDEFGIVAAELSKQTDRKI